MRIIALTLAAFTGLAAVAQQPVLTGQAAFTDWNQEAPGVRHHLTIADLPEPDPSEAVDNTAPIIPRPANAWPIAPAGFKVTLYAGGDGTPNQRSDNVKSMVVTPGTFLLPRHLRTAPNGDLFLSDSGAGTIFVMRGFDAHGKAAILEKYATGLDHPFGLSFYPAVNPKYLYVANANTIQRFPYKPGDLKAAGPAETIVPDVPGYAQLTGGGHWTRDVVFSLDGKHMFVSVGSANNITNVDTNPKEFHRADVLEYTPDGKFLKVYASGIRNCVGEAVNPTTGELWCSVNERDNIGNHLVPDYVTSVPENSFFGWPWYYMGGHRDVRTPEPCANGTGPNPQAASLAPEEAKSCTHVDLSGKVRPPDVIVQPHMASLEMTFYPTNHDFSTRYPCGNDPRTGIPVKCPPALVPRQAFPERLRGNAFVAEHGSWNRKNRTGYEVVTLPMVSGKATGEYDDFLTGFITPTGDVWGRPVGIAIGNDGSLFVADDASRSIWRVAYTGK